MPRHLKCPRCKTIVDIWASEFPVCPSCGYSKRGDPDSRRAAQPEPVAFEAEAAPAAVPTVDWKEADAEPAPPLPDDEARPLDTAGLWDASYRGPVGKLRSPVIVVLLSLVTLGIYALVWWIKVAGEVDAATQRSRARRPMVIGTFLLLSGYVVAVLTVVAAVAAIVYPAYQNFQEDSSAEGSFADNWQTYIDASSPAVTAAVIVVALALLAAFAGAIVRLIAMVRTWQGLRDAQKAAGLAPVPVAALVTMAILAFLLNTGPIGMARRNDAAGSASMNLLGLAGLVLLIIVWAWTQVHLNRLWRAGAEPAPPAQAAARPA